MPQRTVGAQISEALPPKFALRGHVTRFPKSTRADVTLPPLTLDSHGATRLELDHSSPNAATTELPDSIAENRREGGSESKGEWPRG